MLDIFDRAARMSVRDWLKQTDRFRQAGRIPVLPVAKVNYFKRALITVQGICARNRAWTDDSIAELLGDPDAVIRDPEGRIEVYFIERVEAAEASRAFAQLLRTKRAKSIH